jgi:nuclear transport factor 2 (NTF2) superfamily protein
VEAVAARETQRALAGLCWRFWGGLVPRAAGYGYKEIADKLGVTYTNVNWHITEGRAELQELRDAAYGELRSSSCDGGFHPTAGRRMEDARTRRGLRRCAGAIDWGPAG